MATHLRKSEDRGQAEISWLSSKHSFSFGDYFDPKHMGFGVLRVINEDFIQGGKGFATHGHRDMEILSYVVQGVLAHKDSMGHEELIRPGEVQRMTAGTGVRHSEYNHLSTGITQLLQIWILPEKQGLAPSYEQKDFSDRIASGEFVLVASQSGELGSVKIHQDVKVYGQHTQADQDFEYAFLGHRRAWVQVIAADKLEIQGQSLGPGDGLAVEDETKLRISSRGNSHFLLFDLPS